MNGTDTNASMVPIQRYYQIYRAFYGNDRCEQYLLKEQISFLESNINYIEGLGSVDHVIINGEPAVFLYGLLSKESPAWLPFHVRQFDPLLINNIVNEMNNDPNGFVVDYTKCPLLKQ